MKSFLGNFYRHLAIFSGHTARCLDIESNILGRKMGLCLKRKCSGLSLLKQLPTYLHVNTKMTKRG